MKLYIGGAGQGQDKLALRENPGCEIIQDFHGIVQGWIADGIDPAEAVSEMIAAHPGAVVVSDEVGCGVVPMSREERYWREQTGRCQCAVAAASDRVIRVICGIGVRIK